MPLDFETRTTEELIHELRTHYNDALRTAIIERHAPLVHAIARKFHRPGVGLPDLVQTAWVALIRALDRFDPAHNAKFSTYASHCVVGEIKRYFRDRTWSLRAPRRLKEIAIGLTRMQDQLSRHLRREPTMGEMAEAFGTDEETLARAMELRENYQMPSLDARCGADHEEGISSGPRAGDAVGDEDPRLQALVEHAPVRAAIEELEPREQWILQRRYYDGWSQQEVATELHLSQMHISRLERASLRRLRDLLDSGEVPVAA